MFYDASAPEASEKDNPKEHELSLHVIKPALKWLWITTALVITVAIAIGVGVGIWRRHEHEYSSHHPSALLRWGILIDRTFFLTHFYSPSNPVITLAEQHILNDTSLAALVLANGDRHLFFQDNTGLIRRAVRTASNNQWSTSPTLSVDSNAKNHTPLAANQVLSDIIDSPWPSVMPNAYNAQFLRKLILLRSSYIMLQKLMF